MINEYLDIQKRIFNYRLSKARRTIENAFGILSPRWRILRNNIIKVKTVEKIVAATICLHNFVRISENEISVHERVYCPTSFIDMVHSDGNITPGLFKDDHVNSFRKN